MVCSFPPYVEVFEGVIYGSGAHSIVGYSQCLVIIDSRLLLSMYVGFVPAFMATSISLFPGVCKGAVCTVVAMRSNNMVGIIGLGVKSPGIVGEIVRDIASGYDDVDG